MFLVLQAKAVRTWKEALFIIREDDASLLASSGNGLQFSDGVAV
jgi:hypothetical protein